MVEQEETLCDEVETVGEFAYYHDRVSACRGCEAAVTTGTRCGWVMLAKYDKLVNAKSLHLRLNWAIYKVYILDQKYCIGEKYGT